MVLTAQEKFACAFWCWNCRPSLDERIADQALLRSIAGFDFTAALTSISDLLESYGGHAMAAGFVAKTENLPQIEQRLTELLWQQFDKSSLNPQLAIDAEVGLGEMDWNVYSFICQLEPFGMGNPKPVFVTRGVRVAGFKVVGGDGKHLSPSAD